MLYGATAWTTCSSDNLRKVFSLQKRAARVILCADTRANSVKLFQQLEWILFYQDVNINKCSLIFKRLHGKCPSCLEDLLKRNFEKREKRNSRHGMKNLVCPRFKLEIESGRLFTVSGIRLWNSLSSQLKDANCLNSFRIGLFKHYFNSNKNLQHSTIS